MRKLGLVFLLSIIALVSCTETKEETVSLDDISPTSDKYLTDSQREKEQEIENERPEKSVFLPVVDSLFPKSNWKNWDTLLFPDRFGATAVEKWMVKTPHDSLIFLDYRFKDSLRTKNAFFNWLDCFGPTCKSFKVGGNVRIPKRNALLFVGAQHLLLFESNHVWKEKDVRNILEKNPKKQFWLYVIEIPKTGKAMWKRIEKGEEKPIVKIDENS